VYWHDKLRPTNTRMVPGNKVISKRPTSTGPNTLELARKKSISELPWRQAQRYNLLNRRGARSIVGRFNPSLTKHGENAEEHKRAPKLIP